LKAYGELKYRNFRDWFDKRLDAAIEAAEKSELDSKFSYSKYVWLATCMWIVCIYSLWQFVFCGSHM